MLLEAQNRKKMTHFIAACGRAYTPRSSKWPVLSQRVAGPILLEAQNGTFYRSVWQGLYS